MSRNQAVAVHAPLEATDPELLPTDHAEHTDGRAGVKIIADSFRARVAA